MSHKLINLNEDLRCLRDEGYEIKIVDGFLVMDHIPYVKSDKTVGLGRLVSQLFLSGDKTVEPDKHTVKFNGEYLRNHNGELLTDLVCSETTENLSDGLTTNFEFSRKPRDYNNQPRNYRDHHEKMTTYEEIISRYASRIDPNVTAKTFRPIENSDSTSPFQYIDTSSSRSGITAINEKLSIDSVSIIGLGGTGAYVLDLVAKTPVREIHLYDGDRFHHHNAFRAPGAPSIEELKKREYKVDYFKRIYSRMHGNIFANACYLLADNINSLNNSAFTFICIDDGEAKKLIIRQLEELNSLFIDVGMGVERTEDYLLPTLRVTTSTPEMRSHIHENNRIPFNQANPDNHYRSNIQIADLNMLNAALAVTKWKRLYGFYDKGEHEHHSLMTIGENEIVNEEKHVCHN